jgi:hypothetical protein
MRIPRVRFTVRRMMIAVAVVAVNFGLIRGADELTKAHGHNDGLLLFVALTILPALSLLTVAAVDVGFGLVKYGQAQSFSTGYLLLGGLVSFGICIDLATQSFILDAVITTSIGSPGVAYLFSSGEWFADVLLVFVFALPQVILAMIGGGLAKRYGLTIVRSGRAIPDDAAISVTDEV